LPTLAQLFGGSIQNVEVDASNPMYKTVDGVVYDAAMSELIFYPLGKEGAYVLPETISAIRDNMFDGRTGLTSITIHPGVTFIGSYVFRNCVNLKELKFLDDGSSLFLNIGNYTFDGCTGLAEINLPARTSSVGNYVVSNTNIESFTIPAGITWLPQYMFVGCQNLKTINIHANVQGMSSDTFFNAPALENINIVAENPYFKQIDGIIYKLTNGVATTLTFNVATNKGVDGKVVIPSTVTKIEQYAFRNSLYLTEIDASGIDATATYGSRIFQNCASLKVLKLGGNIGVLGAYTTATPSNTSQYIYNCPELEEIYLANTIKSMWRYSIQNCPKLHTIHFAPGGTVDFQIGLHCEGYWDGTRSMFYGCPSLKSLELPANTYNIRDYAFYGNSSVETITFADGADNLYNIGTFAFYNSAIKSFEVPATKHEEMCWAQGIFMMATKLESITIDENSKITFGKYLRYSSNRQTNSNGVNTNDVGQEFMGTNLKTITIPSYWTKITNYMFSGSTLEEIIIPENSSLNYIGNGAFTETYLTEFTVPAAVTYIGVNAFYNVPTLTSFEFEDNSMLEEIGEQAFAYSGVYTFDFPVSMSEAGNIFIGSQLFLGCRNLHTINVSVSVTNGLENAVAGVPNLTTINIIGENPYYTHNADLPMLENGTLILLFYKDYGETILRIPDGVTEIGAGAFAQQASITGVVIPKSVVRIGEGAFMNCFNLKTVEFEAGSQLTFVGNAAFAFTLSLEKITLPYGVSTIGDSIFTASGITEAILPVTVTTIPMNAFAYASELKKVDAPAITTIASSAFQYSGLQEIVLPETLTGIAGYAFAGTKIKTINIPAACCGGSGGGGGERPPKLHRDGGGSAAATGLSNGVFFNCAELETVELGATLTNVPMDVFSGCSSLKNLDFNKIGNINERSFAGTGFVEVVLPNTVTLLSPYAFQGCKQLTSFTIQQTNNISILPSGVLRNCTALEEVNLPDNINTIDWGAFSGSGLTSITLSNNISYVGFDAFSDCVNLVEVVLPQTIMELNDRLFSGCVSLEKVTYNGYTGSENFALPPQLETIYSEVFSGCASLTKVVIEDGVYCVDWAERLFAGCTSLTDVEIKCGGFMIGNFTFEGCTSLVNVSLNENITSVGDYAFAGCENLVNADFIENFVYFGWNAFEGCKSLVQVTLNDNLREIPGYAFADCESLSMVEMPSNVMSIGDRAFYNTDIISMYISAKVDRFGNEVFANCSNLIGIVVDENNPVLYAGEDGILYDIYGNLLAYPNKANNVTELTGDIVANLTMPNVFYGNNTIESIVIPEGVTEICDYAFAGMTALKSVTFPITIQSIGAYAFAGCTALEEINIPDVVTYIGAGAFAGDTMLSKVTLPSELVAISDELFVGCTALTEITVGEKVESIGAFAFEGTAITEISIPANVKSIGDYAFNNSALTTVTMTEGLESIAGYVFANTTALTKVVIPNTVTSIGIGVFANSNVKEVVLPGIQEIGQIFSDGYTYIDKETGELVMDGDESYVEKVVLSEGTEILNGTFMMCTALKEILLPNTLKTIEYGAFANCTALTEIIIPASVTSIGGNAFSSCTNISSIVIPKNAIVNGSAFAGWTATQTIYCEASGYYVANSWAVSYDLRYVRMDGLFFADSHANLVFNYKPLIEEK